MRVVIFLRNLILLPLRAIRAEWTRSGLLERGLRIAHGAIIDCDPGCEILVGAGSSVRTGTLLLAKLDQGTTSRITIGCRTGINEYNNLRAAGGDIRIGNFCQIAQFCSLIAANHLIETKQYMMDSPLDTSRTSIVIEDDVWVGANVVILPGVTVGRGSVIGAGAIVTKDIAPYSICAGNPARVIRHRSLHA
jgi:carbonic anhydrase/acetyltransferase-like protein (isoleucine patch superfamily)